jgi:glycosyltransferase involved in cell wall biosynthesis
MKTKIKKITIIIPCYNEEKGIGKVIDSIPVHKLARHHYMTEIIVVDNNSTDKTAKIALEKNVRVIKETKKGKGSAVKTGFENVSKDTNYIVMLDGDNTYKGSEIIRMIEPLESKFSDVVVGSRLNGKLKQGSLIFQNRVANWAYTFLVRHFYMANTTDVLSGYYAWKKEVVDKVKPYLTSNGFSIEMEMTIKLVRMGYEICSVPITYDRREGITKVETIKDGFLVLHMFTKNFFWRPKESKSATKFTTETISFELK